MSTTSQLSTLDDPVFRRELLTIASFLAGYGTTTRTGYATDPRIFTDWCRTQPQPVRSPTLTP